MQNTRTLHNIMDCVKLLCVLAVIYSLLSEVPVMGSDDASNYVPDTSKFKQILKKGNSIRKSHPDSALFYYQLILDDFNSNGPKLIPEHPTDLEKNYFETVINAANQTGNIYYYRDEYSRAETYYRQSLEIAKQAGLKNFIGKALFDIGYIRYMNNEFLDAGQLFKESFALYTETGDLPGMYSTLNACGLSDKHLGNLDVADSCFNKALTIARKLNDSVLISDIKIHLGILYCEQEKLEEGIILFKEALDFYEKTGNKDAISDALLNIGVVMKMVGENEKALAYIRESTQIEELSQVKSQLVIRYYHLADLYLQMKNNEKAFEFCKKTLTVAEEIASKPFVADCNYLMGKYYFNEKKYKDAISYFATALQTAEKSDDKTLITNIYEWSANAYVQLGEYKKATTYAQHAYNEANDLRMTRNQKEVAHTLVKIYEKTGNIQKALHWFEIYHNISDSINYFDQQKEIKRIEARYNYEKKERENELLRNKTSLQEQKLKNRSVTLFAMLLAIILSIVVIILLIYRIKYNRARSRQQQTETLKKLESLSDALEGKDRELTSKMMFLNQKNELIGRIISQLQELQDTPDAHYSEIHALVNELRSDSNQSNWKEFETQFVQVHPDFYKRLFEKYPSLTSYEQRICAFLRMNLNTKEISNITGRSAKSIEVTRSRIRKKLKLPRKSNLSSFLASV
jgi:tetratricopeptide (TPR) repeat protein